MTLRWILNFDAVSVVIPGSKKPKQVQANAAVSNLQPLLAELHKKLREFYDIEVLQCTSEGRISPSCLNLNKRAWISFQQSQYFVPIITFVVFTKKNFFLPF